MPPCPPQQSTNRGSALPTLEPGEMELTWQEIMSITELQGLTAASEPAFEPPVPSPYPGPPPGPPTYCPCSVHPDAGYPMAPAPYELPGAASHGPEPPFSYGSLALPVSKPLSLSGLLSEPLSDPLTLLDIGLPAGPPPKPHEDPESDSGLSLNYSDAESLELEGTEAGRRRAEYADLFPVEYPPPYPLLPAPAGPPAYPLPPPPAAAAESPSPRPAGAREPPPGPAARAPGPPARGEAGTRDARRARAMQIPFPTEQIVNLPVDDFNELLARYPLSESQLALVRDIRRRGKNKVAAQNCRRRKLETIVQLERELQRLAAERERLLRARGETDRSLDAARRQLAELRRDVLGRLRDPAGNGYSPDEYALQQAPDGAVFLVPRALKQEAAD